MEKITAAVPDKPSKLFSFLPNISSVKTKIDTSKDLILTLSLEHAEFGKIGYRKKDGNTIDIFVTPKEGRFESSDVQIKANQDNFDLIIIVDTPNIERLGGLADPADIFYEIPTINIDHHPANEKFGKINWVELVATSSAEMLVSLIEALGKDKTCR